MLATSTFTDLLAGKLPDRIAHQCLADLSYEKLSTAFIHDAVTSIKQLHGIPECKLFSEQSDSIDCSGTGGSGFSHYNTSTSVAFILAAGGLRVTKFGNRAATGSSSSFDFLEYLGFPNKVPLAALLEILQETNLVFLFAPQFYPALAKLAPIRKTFGKPTIFNLIGPLLNPCQPVLRLIGTPTSISQDIIADYFFSYKVCKKAAVVRAGSGMDELDPNSMNIVAMVDGLSVEKRMFGFSTATPFSNNQQTKTARDSALLFKQMISDFRAAPDYFRNLVTLNAGAGFFLAGKSSSITQGQALAAHLLETGQVLAKYNECRRIYAKYAQ